MKKKKKEIQIPRSHPRPTESETWGAVASGASVHWITKATVGIFIPQELATDLDFFVTPCSSQRACY